RAAGIAMAYKLIEAAQSKWRAVNAPHLVKLVRDGATFEKGKLALPDSECVEVFCQAAGVDE
ncbi:IS256 family transposase, partial [Gordonia desulfuricans]|nr:IS256 family transposase [Gordonia desulfuricans]